MLILLVRYRHTKYVRIVWYNRESICEQITCRSLSEVCIPDLHWLLHYIWTRSVQLPCLNKWFLAFISLTHWWRINYLFTRLSRNTVLFKGLVPFFELLSPLCHKITFKFIVRPLKEYVDVEIEWRYHLEIPAVKSDCLVKQFYSMTKMYGAHWCLSSNTNLGCTPHL